MSDSSPAAQCVDRACVNRCAYPHKCPEGVGNALADELRALVKAWDHRAEDPALNKGCQSGFFFASCGLSEVLRRHGVLVGPVLNTATQREDPRGPT